MNGRELTGGFKISQDDWAYFMPQMRHFEGQ